MVINVFFHFLSHMPTNSILYINSVYCCSFVLSLFPVLPWCLRHLWPVWQTLGPHIDVFLQCPAHLPHHAQLSHRGRESVHPAAPTIHQRCAAVPPRPLRLEQVCLPVWHWSGWVLRMDHLCLCFESLYTSCRCEVASHGSNSVLHLNMFLIWLKTFKGTFNVSKWANELYGQLYV